MKYLLTLLLLLVALPAQAQTSEPFDNPLASCDLAYISFLEFRTSVAWDSLGAPNPRYGGSGSVTMADTTGGGCSTFTSASLDSTLQRFVDRGILTNGVRNGIKGNLKAVIDTLTAVSERWKRLPPGNRH